MKFLNCFLEKIQMLLVDREGSPKFHGTKRQNTLVTPLLLSLGVEGVIMIKEYWLLQLLLWLLKVKGTKKGGLAH